MVGEYYEQTELVRQLTYMTLFYGGNLSWICAPKIDDLCHSGCHVLQPVIFVFPLWRTPFECSSRLS